MSGAGAWAIEALIASALLMLAVLLLRGPVRRQFGPGIAYALWALPALRLLLPPLPSAWRERAATPIAQASDTITVLVLPSHVAASSAPVAQASHAPSLALLLGLGWLAGAAALLAWQGLAHRRFCARLLRGAAHEERLADGTRLIESEAAAGPCAFGIVRRYVVFPRDFVERFDAAERDLALAHELGHHRAGDLVANWVALGVLALHWFNPLAWRAFRAFRADQEMANDARVLAGRDPAQRHAYACAILKAAHGGTVSAACHLHTIHDIKGRLRMLSTLRTSRARRLAGGAAIAALTATGLAASASGTAAAEHIKARVSHATGIAMPAMPAMPSMPSMPEMPAMASFQAAPPAPPAAPAPRAAPEAPEAPELAEAPEAPEAPETAPPPSGDEGHRAHARSVSVTGDHGTKRVRVVVDGRTIRDEVLASMPEVRQGDCPKGDPNKVVYDGHGREGRPFMIVCANRIKALAAQGAAAAANAPESERNAYRSALEGLRSSRSHIATNPRMPEAARREALLSIDQSIAELEADLAHVS